MSHLSQVASETATVLMSSGHHCYVRGDIFVKGKGIITTYFVKTPFDNGNHPGVYVLKTLVFSVTFTLLENIRQGWKGSSVATLLE
jgi:hypothetical protein